MKITLNGNNQKIANEVDAPPYVSHVKIQNPTGNSLLYVGRAGHVDFEIAAGADELFPEKSLHNIWVRGTDTELINVFFGNNK